MLAAAFLPKPALAQAPPPETQRILQAIRANQAHPTAADRAAAHHLTLKGDQAYRQGNYAAAYQAYRDAYPNAPSAYTYILAGDAHWRGILAFNTTPPARNQPASSGACRLQNTYFAHDLAQDLAQHQQVGLALATQPLPQPAPEPPLSATLLSRTREETACLQNLASEYDKAQPTACVDLEKLHHCLGAPLLK